MSLGGNWIQTWEDMKYMFLKRYQDYFRVNEEIFEITQGEEEIWKIMSNASNTTFKDQN